MVGTLLLVGIWAMEPQCQVHESEVDVSQKPRTISPSSPKACLGWFRVWGVDQIKMGF